MKKFFILSILSIAQVFFSVSTALASSNQPPPIICIGGLEAINIQFSKGKKYEVYSAPSTTSLRGADGKATVSTDDWIEVLAKKTATS